LAWRAMSQAMRRPMRQGPVHRNGKNQVVRITAKADYAVRAAVELAAAEKSGKPVKGENLARLQGIPQNFLENILTELRRSGIIRTRRGAEGGYQLARPATEITVADVLRAVEGPLAAVQGIRPDQLSYQGAAERLPEVWVALRSSLRDVLEHVTLADIARGRLPAVVKEHTRAKDAWRAH
jgi:Rrf2 family protein